MKHGIFRSYSLDGHIIFADLLSESHLLNHIFVKIPWLARDGRLYLDRDLCFSLSRLPALSEWAGQLMRGNLSRMEDGDEVRIYLIYSRQCTCS